jgi:hypothetical protein
METQANSIPVTAAGVTGTWKAPFSVPRSHNPLYCHGQLNVNDVLRDDTYRAARRPEIRLNTKMINATISSR